MANKKHEYNLGEAIQALMVQYKMNDKLFQVTVRKMWAEIVGNFIDERTKEFACRDGVIFIQVHSAPLRNELLSSKEFLLKQFQARLGEKKITDIRFA
jgi:predicted nucleic acid-binding Zn ribbon protein